MNSVGIGFEDSPQFPRRTSGAIVEFVRNATLWLLKTAKLDTFIAVETRGGSDRLASESIEDLSRATE
jgi:hypothetical protein